MLDHTRLGKTHQKANFVRPSFMIKCFTNNINVYGQCYEPERELEFRKIESINNKKFSCCSIKTQKTKLIYQN